jgi:predicted DCC family thiol-disulfide oxidoreductase YuxK
MITVFYDGKCGLCRREIAYYIRIAPEYVFEWIDITVAPETFIALGYPVANGLKALHVRDATGVMHIGVDGFIIIWQQLARWRALAFVVRLPIIHPVARRLYAVFATWRFKKLGYASCDI